MQHKVLLVAINDDALTQLKNHLHDIHIFAALS